MSVQKESSIERLPGPRVTCTVTFSDEEVRPIEEKALQKLGSETKLKGFRPGKAPADMMRESVDTEKLLEETIRQLLPQTIERLITEHELKPIIPPKIEAISRSPLTLNLTFVEKPDVSLKGVKKIKIEKSKSKVDDAEVAKMIDFVLSKHQKVTPVDRAIAEGDQVTMDFHGETKEGEEIDSIKEEDYAVIIGSKSLLPGFEDELKGLKQTDKKSFTLTFPEKHEAEKLRGKPVTFHVTIKQVAHVKKPELTDAFAKEQLGSSSADDFKAQVKRSMEQQEEDVERKRREQQLFDAISDATVVEIAPELSEEETRNIVKEIDQRLQQQGKTLEDWLKQQTKKPEEVQKDLQAQAEKRLRLRLGIQKLIDERNIEVSDEEIQKAIDVMLARLPEKEREPLRAAYAKGQNAYEQIKWQKKVEKVIDSFLAA